MATQWKTYCYIGTRQLYIQELDFPCPRYRAHTESFDNASSQPNYEAIMSAEKKIV